jgi:hypothetical protein
LFAGLNARIQLLPVMNADDLKKELDVAKQANVSRQIQKAPALEPGSVTKEENAAPHHVWDSTIKAFHSFKANLRDVISLAADALARTL